MANPEWTEPWEWEDCAKCGASPVREILDDEPLCQDCCDEWAQNESKPVVWVIADKERRT